MKKILAFVLAMLMVMAMGTVALAADQNTDGTFGTSTSAGSSIGTWVDTSEAYTAGITTTTFNVHFDVTGDDASRPKTQFAYTIANGAAVDATQNSPAIKAGVTGGATLPATAVTDAWNSVNSAEATDTIQLSFDASKFSAPGIYRYVLTQTDLTDEQTAIGIVNGDTTGAHTEKVLSLDVYVGYIGNELKVTAAVLTTEAESPALSDANNLNGTLERATYTKKIDGFYNSYTSYSVTLQKVVTGDAGDKTYSFPFTLQLGYVEGEDVNTTIDGVTVTATVDNANKATVAASYAISATATNITGITMKDGGKITLTGLPKQAIVKLMETVDVGEAYNITSVVTSMANSVNLTAAGTHTEATFTTTGTINGTAGADITYTNNRPSISPTGVVMRVAPFAIMLGAGVVLLVLSKKRKSEN